MDYQEVIEKLGPVVENDPANPAFARLAEALLETGNIRKALSILTEGVKANPTYTTGQMILAKCLKKAGYSSQAKERYEIVLRLDPYNSAALSAIAQIEFEEGNTNAAFDALKRILSFDPFNDTTQREIERKSRELYGEPEPTPEIILEPTMVEKLEKTEDTASELDRLLSMNVSASVTETPGETRVPIEEVKKPIEPQSEKIPIPAEPLPANGVIEGPIFTEDTEKSAVLEGMEPTKPVEVYKKEPSKEQPVSAVEKDKEGVPSFAAASKEVVEKPDETKSIEELTQIDKVTGEEVFVFSLPRKSPVHKEPEPVEEVRETKKAPPPEPAHVDTIEEIEKRVEFEPIEGALDIEGILKKTEFVPPKEEYKKDNFSSIGLEDTLDLTIGKSEPEKSTETDTPEKPVFTVTDEPATVTMAEIYAGQGQTTKAIEIYETILKDTEDEEKKEKIEKRIEHLKTILENEKNP